MDLDDLAEFASRWPAYSADGRIHLGVAWRGTGGSNPAMRVPRRLYEAEITAVRDLGLPVSVHACGPAAAAGQVRDYADAGLLGPDLQLVHLNNASAAEIALAAQAPRCPCRRGPSCRSATASRSPANCSPPG